MAVISESKEKFWDELTDDEKIERMRNMIKGLQKEQDRLRGLLYRFEQHSHDSNGRPVVPFLVSGGPSAESGYADNRWF